MGGRIYIDRPLQLYSGSKAMVPVGMMVAPHKGINYGFSEKHLRIDSEEGIILSVAGLKLKVKNVSYHADTGRFEVQTDTPLNIGEKSLNQAIEKHLDDYYRPKIMRAFKALKTLREKRNLHDVNKVIGSIVGIFSDGQGVAPTVSGDMELRFFPLSNRRLRLHQWNAEIKKDDVITFGMDFVKPGSTPLKINAVNFISSRGIRISGKTSFPEIASVNFQEMHASGNGIRFNYDIGAEEVISGFMLLMNAVKMASGHPGDILQECDPVRIQSIRKSLDNNLRNEIALMIRTHRSLLLNAGASRELLAALD